MNKTKNVDGPHSPIFDNLPNFPDVETLTIMHVRLRWVVTKNSVNHDNLLPVPRDMLIGQLGERE